MNKKTKVLVVNRIFGTAEIERTELTIFIFLSTIVYK